MGLLSNKHIRVQKRIKSPPPSQKKNRYCSLHCFLCRRFWFFNVDLSQGNSLPSVIFV